jgi:hypothetical protein
MSVAVEIPLRVKEHLRLDSERSWVILNEVNVFTWPGFDLPTNQERRWACRLPLRHQRRLRITQAFHQSGKTMAERTGLERCNSPSRGVEQILVC